MSRLARDGRVEPETIFSGANGDRENIFPLFSLPRAGLAIYLVCSNRSDDHLSIPIYAVSECEEREAQKKWFMMTPGKVAPTTGTILRTTGPVPADSRQ